MPALNKTQIELLKLFNNRESEEELLEVKKVLTDFLADKIVKEADNNIQSQNISAHEVENWKNQHFRSKKH